VFLYESAAKTNMTRLRGRAPRGERVHDSTPAGHWCTTTMIGSVRLDGPTVCMTIEEATDTDIFRAYVQRVPIPKLQPGDVVVLDNLPPHKNSETIRLIEQAGASVRLWFSPNRCRPGSREVDDSLSFELLQRCDLSLKPGGNLPVFLPLLQLDLLKMFHGGLLFGCGLTVFGLTEPFLGLLDLNVHFLRRLRELLQRRLTKNLSSTL
jgi:hypothetical protein